MLKALADLSWFQVVGLLATIAGLVQTLWIGLRKNHADLMKELATVPRTGRSKRKVVFWAPYVGVVACWALVLISALWPRERLIRHHLVQRISSPRAAIEVNGCLRTDLYSDDEHFAVNVEGVFFGPELETLRKLYGGLESVRVYAVVSEESRPPTRGLMWLQAKESGHLDERGHYRAAAFFGGTGTDSAREGELFALRVYVPEDKQATFPVYAVYDAPEKLPPPIFISDPIYVRVLRSTTSPGRR